jgi:hypothetical protein
MSMNTLSNSDVVLRLFVAAAFGSIIGFERERLLWAAGIRTHIGGGLYFEKVPGRSKFNVSSLPTMASSFT